VKASDLIPLKERGRGAFGVVYEMQHRDSGTIMAVKVHIVTSVLCFVVLNCYGNSHPAKYCVGRF